MLPVSLRFNISILHLFLFTLIPEHTPIEEKINKQMSLLNHLIGSPDQALIFVESKIHQLFQTVFFSYSRHEFNHYSSFFHFLTAPVVM